jgi:hypothetical protein
MAYPTFFVESSKILAFLGLAGSDIKVWLQNIDIEGLRRKIFRCKELEEAREWHSVDAGPQLDFFSEDFARTIQLCTFYIHSQGCSSQSRLWKNGCDDRYPLTRFHDARKIVLHANVCFI